MRTNEAKLVLVSRCPRPVGQIVYEDGRGYKDSQMIPAGRTAEEMKAIRFPGGVPAGWTVRVITF